jgi:streptogramin lyase
MFNDNGITAGPDGALWFTDGATNQIDRITIAGEFSEVPYRLRMVAPSD